MDITDTEWESMAPRMKEVRKAARLTQKQLAEKLEMGVWVISRLETARYFPDMVLLDYIAEAIGVPTFQITLTKRLEEPQHD